MWPGLASLAPTTYTKTCPAYATPFVPTLLKTASPERLLRPPLASSPASNFFSLYNAPLSGGLRQLFVYVAEAPPPCFTFFLPLQCPPLRRPQATFCICGRGPPPASHFFSLYTVPSQKASGKSHSKASPHIQKLAPLMLPPSYLPSLKPLSRNAFQGPPYPPPLLQIPSPFTLPPLKRPRASLCICGRGLLPRNAFEGPPKFSLYTAPLRRPWASLSLGLPSLKPLPRNGPPP